MEEAEGGAGGGSGAVGEAVVNPAALLAGVEESGGFEEREVFGDGGGGELEEFGDLADAKFSGGDGEEGADAVFVGEGIGDGEELVHEIHFVISSYNEMIDCRRWEVKALRGAT